MSDEAASAAAPPATAAASSAPAPAAAHAVGPATQEPRGPGHGVYESRHAPHDADTGLLNDTMHALGVPPEVGSGVLDWIDGCGENASPAEDAAHRQAGIAELRALWPGDEYERNITLANQYLANNLPQTSGALLSQARIGGRLLLNDAVAVVKLVALAKRGAKLSAAGGDLETDIRNIETVMRTDPDAYYRDEALQTRLRSLYGQRLAKQKSAA